MEGTMKFQILIWFMMNNCRLFNRQYVREQWLFVFFFCFSPLPSAFYPVGWPSKGQPTTILSSLLSSTINAPWIIHDQWSRRYWRLFCIPLTPSENLLKGPSEFSPNIFCLMFPLFMIYIFSFFKTFQFNSDMIIWQGMVYMIYNIQSNHYVLPSYLLWVFTNW